MNIHENSIVHPNANIGNNVSIGAFCIIEDNVTIGEGTILHPYVQVMSGTIIGKNNVLHQGSIIGGDPQDLKYKGEKTSLHIGNNNVIREFCTLNKGTEHSEKTIIGNECLLMAYVHVAHDCVVEDKVILANGVQLGGHAIIEYHATVGGMSPVHQFCKVGTHSFIGGGRVALQDIPPYILATGEPLQYSGINSIGLRRRNFTNEVRNTIKKAYNQIYRSKMNTKQAIEYIDNNFEQTKEIKTIIKFINNSDRGII